MSKFEFKAIGTDWVIDIMDYLSKDEEAVLLDKIKKRAEEFDITYSRFRGDSLVTKMSKTVGEYTLPDDADKMISIYKKAYDLTHGLVTPLIGQVLVDAGYDEKYSLVKREMTIPKKWEEVMEWKNPILKMLEPSILDFGACGKGYLVDIISEIIEHDGIKSYTVDGSGDMRQRSVEGIELRVGLEHPDDKEKVIGVIEIKNQSLCGSAGNRRKWADVHHIINPETLSSPKHILAVWVIADDTITSDILTTCLFFVSPEILQNDFKFEYLVLNNDFSVSKSEGFEVELFNS